MPKLSEIGLILTLWLRFLPVQSKLTSPQYRDINRVFAD
ncbi:hypothetical protein VL20_5279 [Microcystis panniformis FACHB-1757]|uniref:Uncharacterized protein n=1 Tax=Microcystis panniformis FACHB-1757 TaxID=1638788 RepID=A0A0K1S7N3_9CHRO|nr:hypothetical protein VL20_5279 [Microcystis panniformis FACHB-1757]